MGRIEIFLQKIPIRLLLVLPLALYLGVSLFWQSKGFYKLVGDELHYLLVAESLITDGDVLVKNNYSIDTPVQRASGLNLAEPIHSEVHLSNEYSRHSLGLPLIVSIPYFIAGIAGAKIFMVLLAGLWPLLIYRTLSRITESNHWSALVACSVGIGLPFVAGANQVLPDLLGGMIILHLAEKIFRIMEAMDELPSRRFADWWIGILIGFLPWLHIRLIAPAIVLLGGYIYAVAARSRRQTGVSFRRGWIFPATIVVCTLILLAVYNQIAFSNPFGPYGNTDLTFELRKIAMIFLGLHWDQTQGMFVQQPLLLLALVGVAPFVKANWRGAALIGILYLSILLPNSMHPAWYGGSSFVGRFWWTGIGLLIFPLAYAVRLLLKRSKRFLLSLCGIAIILQGWLAYKWLLLDFFLIRRELPIWARRSFFDDTGALLLLPTFDDFSLYLIHPSNYVAVFFGLLLVFTGWLLQRGVIRANGKKLGASLALGAAIVVFVPPAIGSWKLYAGELQSRIGTLEATSRVATDKDGVGTLAFGPYAPLLAGDYEVTVEYEFDHPPGTGGAQYDIVYGVELRLVSVVEMPRSETNGGVFKHRFTVRESQSLGPVFQFRIHYPGHGTLRLDRLTITPISLHP